MGKSDEDDDVEDIEDSFMLKLDFYVAITITIITQIIYVQVHRCKRWSKVTIDNVIVLSPHPPFDNLLPQQSFALPILASDY